MLEANTASSFILNYIQLTKKNPSLEIHIKISFRGTIEMGGGLYRLHRPTAKMTVDKSPVLILLPH